MRSSHWVRHARKCMPCYAGHLCDQGREILTTRWTLAVPCPANDQAAQPINVRALILGGGA